MPSILPFHSFAKQKKKTDKRTWFSFLASEFLSAELDFWWFLLAAAKKNVNVPKGAGEQPTAPPPSKGVGLLSRRVVFKSTAMTCLRHATKNNNSGKTPKKDLYPKESKSCI